MKNQKKIILISIILLIIIAGFYFIFHKKEEIKENNPAKEEMTIEKNQNQAGLKIEVIQPGQGKEAENGNIVAVHYTGKLENGAKFDSSVDRGQPFVFTLGAGQVIKGWDLGILGMKVGEKRKLTIPSDLGYGSRGTPGGPIPPNATLIFEVELLSIR